MAALALSSPCIRHREKVSSMCLRRGGSLPARPARMPLGYKEESGHYDRRLLMKRSIARTSLAIVSAAALLLGLVPMAQAAEHRECSNATLQGSFGYSSTGTLLDSYVPPPFAGPFGEVGRQAFDGKGNTDATATLSANGNIQKVTIQGTYIVNPDCTGYFTLNVSPLAATVHADLVIDDDGVEIRAIGTDAGVVETRVYRKQSR